MLRLRLLGEMTARYGDRPLAMPSSERARALIGWLALHPGLHPRSTVAARLWPDSPAAGARASLRTAVWAVRQSWGPAAAGLVTTRQEIGLPAAGVWVDALHDTGAEYDGELLPGIGDDWAEQARRDYHDRLRGWLTRLAERPDGDTVRYARRLTRLDPLDESAHRLLLEKLVEAGDAAGATRAAREFTERLRAELGVRPSPPTRAVHARLAGPVAAPERPALFGRAEPVRRLTDLWRAAAAGAGQVVVLTGEAGIGKTSLLAEAVRRAERAGARTAVGAGSDVVGETPYGVWLDLARALVATAARPPASAAWPVELNRLAPQLGARLGRPGDPPAVRAPELERLRVFEAMLRLVEWSCADRPALLAMDDAHRADRPSLRLMAHIGRRVGRLPILLVLTRRDQPPRPELDAVLGDLAGRRVPVTELTIGPISDAEVAALAARLVHDETSVRQVVAAAEGNPLLAVESARVLSSGGAGPPPNLRHAIRATAGLLPPAAQSLVRLLATAGRPLSSAELDRLGVDDVGAAEQSAGAAGLLVRREGRLGFRHELLREAVYADLPGPERLHERVAAALDPADHAGIARHLDRAGRRTEAARSWAAAAAFARTVGALSEAAAFLERALALTPGDGRLWLEAEEIWAWLNRRTEMEAAWSRALSHLDRADLPRAWCRRGRQLRTVVCHPEESRRAYLAARDASPGGADAETLIGLAWGEAVAGDPAAAESLLAEAESRPEPLPAEAAEDIVEIRMQGRIRQGRFADAVALARRTGPVTTPGRAYAVWVNAACALCCLGDYDGALELADRAVAATEPIPPLLISCLAGRAHILARLGRHAEAAATAQRERDLADRLDLPALAAVAAHDAGLVALAGGDPAEAARLLGAALDAGAAVSRPTAGLHRAEALARLGDPEAATAALRSALLEPVSRADQPWALVPRVAWVQALIARARGDEPLARRRLAESAAGWRSMPAGASAEGYTAALLDLGRPPVAGLVEPRRELERIEEELRCPASP
ncbi:ATP-binding protein [Actinoplanes sp. CA-030573]|uniref:ATP-binding protein n=1 Tax=Actinoplanes sp. CA-030573 TaxID=3239898 RepID=UPI003D8D54B8